MDGPIAVASGWDAKRDALIRQGLTNEGWPTVGWVGPPRKRWKSFPCSGGIELGVNWLGKEEQPGFCDQDQPRFRIR